MEARKRLSSFFDATTGVVEVGCFLVFLPPVRSTSEFTELHYLLPASAATKWWWFPNPKAGFP